MITRRSLIAVGALAGLGMLNSARAEALPAAIVHKDPNCGCCAAWVDHLRAAGFSVTVDERPAMWGIKQRLGIPSQLASCHTAEIGGYIIEGHVPASAIIRLLKEKPAGKGLAVPGMPIGSPGMEVEGREPEAYDVILFGAGEDRIFARFKGVAAI